MIKGLLFVFCVCLCMIQDIRERKVNRWLWVVTAVVGAIYGFSMTNLLLFVIINGIGMLTFNMQIMGSADWRMLSLAPFAYSIDKYAIVFLMVYIGFVAYTLLSEYGFSKDKWKAHMQQEKAGLVLLSTTHVLGRSDRTIAMTVPIGMAICICVVASMLG